MQRAKVQYILYSYTPCHRILLSANDTIKKKHTFQQGQVSTFNNEFKKKIKALTSHSHMMHKITFFFIFCYPAPGIIVLFYMIWLKQYQQKWW
jgi:hypothetical protein